MDKKLNEIHKKIIPTQLTTIPYNTNSFKCLKTCTFTYATPTFITEAHYLVTQVQLLLTTYSEFTPYTALANSCWVSLHDVYQCQGHAH